jgi:hypothetical protein
VGAALAGIWGALVAVPVGSALQIVVVRMVAPALTRRHVTETPSAAEERVEGSGSALTLDRGLPARTAVTGTPATFPWPRSAAWYLNPVTGSRCFPFNPHSLSNCLTEATNSVTAARLWPEMSRISRSTRGEPLIRPAYRRDPKIATGITATEKHGGQQPGAVKDRISVHAEEVLEAHDKQGDPGQRR